jgi:uncharacterized YigZ family protein
MIVNLKTIKNDSYTFKEEIKKSRFISDIFFVENEIKAKEIINQSKKNNEKASHVTYAYRLGIKNFIEGFSDDGEPAGTAGKQILNVINKKELSNVLIIVVRYFGGTLLGTGGLTKAYTNAALSVINESDIVNVFYNIIAEIKILYSDVDKIQYFLKQEHIKIIQENYGSIVSISILIPEQIINKFETKFLIYFNSKYTLKIIKTIISKE